MINQPTRRIGWIPQVSKNHYYHKEYDKKERWLSYWYQINEVFESKQNNILEVGIGNRLVADYLKKRGFKVTTCDIDEQLKPDIVASVDNLPFKQNSFDFVLCSQVLEHIPFDMVPKALQNLRRVTRQWVLISLPDFSITYFHFAFKLIPFIPKVSKSIKLRLPVKHTFSGEHYWEIGKRGYSLSKIRNLLKAAGFRIVKDYLPEENLFHHFFLLKK